MADPTTLDELLTKRAEAMSEQELDIVISGLREQRSRWLANQATGTRKLVKSKSIPVGMEIDPSAMKPTRVML